MYLLDNGKLGTADEKIKELNAEKNEWKKKFKELNSQLMCELRDPNGTIWEHAKSLQDQLDAANKKLKKCNSITRFNPFSNGK